MRLTYVVPRYLPHLGGVENHVAALACRMQARGHAVTVATQLEGDPSLPRQETLVSGVVILRFPSAVQVRGQGLSSALWRWLREGAGGADLVHLHNHHALTTLASVVAARKPFILTPHYLGPGTGFSERALHSLHSQAMRLAVRGVGRVICVTRSEADSYARIMHLLGRCAVIPNGVDIQGVQQAKPVALKSRLLVTAGRLEEYKQPHLVLRALGELPPDFVLALLGAGPMESQLRQQARDLGVDGRVLFPGKLTHSEVFSWFRAADVVVSMSRRECYGMTLAEGMVAGAAVVGSDIPAHRDVIEESGNGAAVLVGPYARAREVALAVLQAARLSKSGALHFSSWDQVASRTEEVYLDTLARK